MNAYQFYTETYHFTDPKLINVLVENSEKRHYKKGDVIIRIGEKQNDICFMESGIYRGFILDYHGNERTDCFGTNCGKIAMGFEQIVPNTISQITFEMLAEGDFPVFLSR